MIIIFNFLTVDMCAECDPHARCINGKCFCRRGYSGDGFSCKRGRFVPFNENEKSLITDTRTVIIFVNPKYLSADNAMKKSPLIASIFIPFHSMANLHSETFNVLSSVD